MTNTKRSAIRCIDETHAQVTKAFAKNAMVFGTEEFYAWREYKTFFPNATMVCKTIKKAENKKNSTRNLTYPNMAIYIKAKYSGKEQEKMLNTLKTQIALSKVQTNPYRFVLAWFKQTFENYDENYHEFFKALAEKEAMEKSIFKPTTENIPNLSLVGSGATDTNNHDLDLEDAG